MSSQERLKFSASSLFFPRNLSFNSFILKMPAALEPFFSSAAQSAHVFFLSLESQRVETKAVGVYDPSQAFILQQKEKREKKPSAFQADISLVFFLFPPC